MLDSATILNLIHNNNLKNKNDTEYIHSHKQILSEMMPTTDPVQLLQPGTRTARQMPLRE